MAGNATSTLDIRLVDDVSMPASKVAEALERVAAKEKAVSTALAGSGLRDKIGDQLKAMGAGVTHVEAASAAWKQFAASQKLAADATSWTKTQTAAVKRWEDLTKASIRAVMGEERAMAAALEKSQRRAAEAAEKSAHSGILSRIAGAHGGGGFDVGGAIAGAVAAHSFIHGMEGVLETYREFDKEKRYGKVVMGLTDEQQRPLVEQAIHGGGTTKFNDIQWLEAQREFAARGYKLDQVKAFTPIAANIGAAFDKTLPEAVKAIEGAMLGFGKDVSTYEKAVAAARQTADFEVKASKISGMSFDDITQLYKYGASPAKMAGLSEAQLLAFGGVLKKNNMGGDEAGTAFRALAKNLLTPSHGALVAMRANGIDFSKYQGFAARPMDASGFGAMVAQQYGVVLNAATQAGITKIFSDPKMVGDASKFTPAVTKFLKGALGGDDAKSLKSIAGLAKDYRNASVSGVDTVRLLTDMMTAMSKNKGLANALFGSKQGGRIFAALSDPEVFNGLLEQIKDHSAGFAQNVSDARMAGFDGAMSMLEGSFMNLKSSIGRALDNGGEGDGGYLTAATRAAARFTQTLAEADPKILGLGTAAAGVASLWGAGKVLGLFTGATALKGSALELDAAAGKLSAAAARLGGGGPTGGPGGGPGGTPGGPGSSPGYAPLGWRGLLAGWQFWTLANGMPDALKKAETDNVDLDEGMPLEMRLKRWFGGGGATRGPADAGDRMRDRAASLPPPMMLDPGLVERARRSAEAFQADAEAERGRRMMELFGPAPTADRALPLERRTLGTYMDRVGPAAAAGTMPTPTPPPDFPAAAPSVDTSKMHAAAAEAAEVGAQMQTALSVSASPTVNTGSLQAFIGLLREAISLQGQLGAVGSVPGARSTISAGRSFNRKEYGTLGA